MARTFHYQLRVSDALKSVVVNNLPELSIDYQESINKLTDCYYDPQGEEPCGVENVGSVAIKFVVNGADITVRSDDEENESSSLIDLGGSYLYLFQGTGFEVVNYSRKYTYLLFIIRKMEKKQL